MAFSCWKRLSGFERGLTVISWLGFILSISLVIAICVLVSNHPTCDTDANARDQMLLNMRLPMEDELEQESWKYGSFYDKYCVTPACIHAASDLLKNMDRSVHPCDDFYKFACGNFLEKIPIPDDKVSVTSLSLITDELQGELRRIIEETVELDDHKHIGLVKNLYKSCMDRQTIAMQGVQPLLTMLEELGGWPVLEGENWNETNFHWIESVYKFHDMGIPSDNFIKIEVAINLKDSTRRVIRLDQPSLGLSREHFVLGNTKVINAYRKYMIDTAVFLGAPREVAEEELTESYNFEQALATYSISMEHQSNISLLYVPMTIKELSENYPSMPWKEYFNRLLVPTVTIDDDEIIIVNVPEYLMNFVKLMNTTSPRIQANYIMWRAVGASIPYLSEDVRGKLIEFNEARGGTTARQSRWKECVQVVSDRLPFSVSSLYIKKFFYKNVTMDVMKIVQDVKREFTRMLMQADWMDMNTQEYAFNKVHSMSIKIGNPDELLDDETLDKFYYDLDLSGDSFLESILDLTRFDRQYSIRELRKPNVKTHWTQYGNVIKLNSHYSPIENSIKIPAAILQGRYYHINRPKYMNYGGLGFLIGHELTHGFDCQGRQYDIHGNLDDWWSPSSDQKYLRKVQCIVDQYSKYFIPEVGLHINGENTRDENVADNIGIKVAYLAYKIWVSNNRREKRLPGLKYTPKQLFWISAANIWCAKRRREHLNFEMATDTHSPFEFRTLGPFSNMIDFARDFRCLPGTKMNPQQKCDVW